jgi:hypothetical protein
MEATVKKFSPRYCIVRLGNITWGKNPHTLINYLRAHPEAKILNEYRFIADEEEFLFWINMIPNFNCEINIPGKRILVQEVVDEYCRNR